MIQTTYPNQINSLQLLKWTRRRPDEQTWVGDSGRNGDNACRRTTCHGPAVLFRLPQRPYESGRHDISQSRSGPTATKRGTGGEGRPEVESRLNAATKSPKA